jgi:hypothetical protein
VVGCIEEACEQRGHDTPVRIGVVRTAP